MADELPYFKFKCSEWNDGDITLESFAIQGLFINICSVYWSKEGNLTLSKAIKRFPKADPAYFQSLINSNIIKVLEDDKISISFLDEQLKERSRLSQKNSRNGSLGGRPKKPKETQIKPTAFFSESETKAKKSNIEKRREEKNVYIPDEKIHIGIKNKFQIAIKPVYLHEKPIIIYDLQEYFTQTSQIQALQEKGWDKFTEFLESNPGRVFNDQEHVYNAFKSFCLTYIPPEKKVAYNAFNEAEYNKSLWTLEAWEKRYDHELKTNQEFIKHFGYEKLRNGTCVGGGINNSKGHE